MRHKRGGSKLGRVTAHRWALFRNQLTALLQHERITTTAAKAKALRPLADHLVTLGKREDLHARRQALSLVHDTAAVRKLFDTVAARYADRRGGYTRVLSIGPRHGDGAPMAILELVDRAETPKEKKTKERKKGEPTGKAARKQRKAAAAAASG
ncbi:MAG TPA: 50S ribosomal protein L17 [Methylomirabilota bacterium]|jgi:large subunit ribosomal protein L17|nr:50S ribosomal protein L17 [Methylomirabilota bacterium]